MGPALAYASEHPQWHTLVAMRDLLFHLYGEPPPLTWECLRGTIMDIAARLPLSPIAASALQRT